MKANEFIKKYGIAEAKSLVNAPSWTMRQIALSTVVDTKELTKVVESHELVEEWGGLKKSREYLDEKFVLEWTALDGKLSQAITDVESCQ